MATVVRKVEPGTNDADILREAAHCLADGGLVVFPTETVYGLGANAASHEALARLRRVKGRPENKPFTLHVGSRSAVGRFVPELGGIGRRLMQKAWPGPLTLVFGVQDAGNAPVIRETPGLEPGAMYHEGTIGIRCPDDPVAAHLLNAVGVPVVAASANPAGAPAPCDAERALAMLDGQADLVLDAGRTRYGKPSTIVRVNATGYEVLREGVLDERTIRRLARLNFLLICAGNTCRSAMAEALLRRLLADRLRCNQADLTDRGYHVESAGTAAMDGVMASAMAVDAMRARGMDLSRHRATALTLEAIRRADYIFTMTMGQLGTVSRMAPEGRDRCRLLDETDIEDPMGSDEELYARCADRMESALRRQLEEIPI